MNTSTVAIQRRGRDYEPVDIAIVVESTYPYHRGGVSAVVHDIVQAHPDKTIGIIHITWDSSSPAEDLYGMPPNVCWVFPLYLSMNEHIADFRTLSPSALRTDAQGRRARARHLFTALRAAADQQDYTELWRLYDEGMNPRTRSYQLWALLGTKEFLSEAQTNLTDLELSLTNLFWLLREFFSLACAIMSEDYPRANIYHSHTTGYAALAAAVGARQNSTQFLLTEHNLYTRDAINMLLGRSLNQVVRAEDWRRARGVSPEHCAWMAWYIEIGRVSYDAAAKITYLYPQAIEEAFGLGAPLDKAFVLPNGVPVESFDLAHQRFRERGDQQHNGHHRTWRLAYAGRIVPIKGLLDLLDALALLKQRGAVKFTLDLMGHDDESPDYAAQCRQRCTQLGLDDVVKFVGSQNLQQVLGDYDLLVLSSYNEAQPIVVLEAMTIGLPVVGTRVGGMQQLIEDPLSASGHDDRGGVLVKPGDPRAMAHTLETVLTDPGFYQHLRSNARQRVLAHFRLEQAMAAYRTTYQQTITADGPAPQPELVTVAPSTWRRRAGTMLRSVVRGR